MHTKESFNNFLVYFGTIPIESALFFGFSDSSPEIIHGNYTWTFIESYPSDSTSNLYRDAPPKNLSSEEVNSWNPHFYQNFVFDRGLLTKANKLQSSNFQKNYNSHCTIYHKNFGAQADSHRKLWSTKITKNWIIFHILSTS